MGIVPKPYSLLSIDGEPVLRSGAHGVHVASAAAVAQGGPEPTTFDEPDTRIEDVTAWAESVPTGSAVLIGVIDPDGHFGSIIAALAGAGLGCPHGLLPAGCTVAAAVGRKGDHNWYTTH